MSSRDALCPSGRREKPCAASETLSPDGSKRRRWVGARSLTGRAKIGAKVVHHARAVTFQLAEVAVPGSCSR